MPEDPHSDPVTGVLYNKLGLGTAAGLEAAEREITHAARLRYGGNGPLGGFAVGCEIVLAAQIIITHWAGNHTCGPRPRPRQPPAA